MPDPRDHLARLLADNRLSDTARLIGLWVAHQDHDDDGFVEARFDDIRSVLYGFPSDDSIRRHLRMLKGSGWAERKAGGFGKGDLYRILDPHLCIPYKLDEVDSGKDRPALVPSLKDRPALVHTLSGTRPAPVPSLSPPLGREIDREVGSTPSVVSPRADALIVENSDTLAGCRGALRDYIASKVPSRLQRGFVGTVLGYLNGMDESLWRKPDGSRVADAADRVKWVGAALNELAATDETTRKHKEGDPRNLRNKISGLIKDAERKAHGHGRTASQARGGATEVRRIESTTGLGSNQPPGGFAGFDNDAA